MSTADDLKDLGNRCFSLRKYNDAVSFYSKAIIKNPATPTFFTNRALCYLKLKQWELACQDCRKAIEMERSLIKGHFFLGQALVELAYYDESITSLNRAYEFAKDKKMNFGNDITSALRMAKKRRWNVIEERRIQEEIELQRYLNQLIKDDTEREDVKDGEDSDEQISSVKEENEKKLEQVNNLFAQLDERRKKRDVPDYLCGRISFELMREPVITPNGITYDKKDITEHLQRVGHFDPVTRTDLTLEQLIPNLAMKEVIDTFLEENPWAEEY